VAAWLVVGDGGACRWSAAPFRALIGSPLQHAQVRGHRLAARAVHLRAARWCRSAGLAIMPFALLVLARQGDAAGWCRPVVGQICAPGLAFLLSRRRGLHATARAVFGLALAADLTPARKRPTSSGSCTSRFSRAGSSVR